MQGEAGAFGRPRNQGKVPFYAEETGESSPPLPISLAFSLSEPPSPSSAGSSPSSASSSSSSSSSSLSSVSCRARRSTIVDEKKRSKSSKELCSTKERHAYRLHKPFSEPSMPFMEEPLAMEAAAAEKACMGPHAMYRRCTTDTDFKTIQGVTSPAAPDLLQLFNIFQFNTPQKPPARMLVNVTLVGNIQAVRLLVAYDATVQDVIKASLKGYAKEGRLSRHCIKNQTYGLHLSPFSLECIEPTEMICSLGTRNFYLFPRVDQLSNPTQLSQEGKRWWNILGLLLT